MAAESDSYLLLTVALGNIFANIVASGTDHVSVTPLSAILTYKLVVIVLH